MICTTIVLVLSLPLTVTRCWPGGIGWLNTGEGPSEVPPATMELQAGLQLMVNMPGLSSAAPVFPEPPAALPSAVSPPDSDPFEPLP